MDGTVTKGQQNQTDETRNPATEPQVSQRQGIREMCRDISGKEAITCINQKGTVYCARLIYLMVNLVT